MISLKKFIDEHQNRVDESAIAAFRSSLVAMAKCGQRAIPPLGVELKRKLSEVQGVLHTPVTPDELDFASRRLELELSVWADLAVQLHDEAEREMREILFSFSQAAESVSRRDKKYSRQIDEITGKLRSVARLDDIAAIRRSVVESAAALKTCVEQMAEDSKASVDKLSGEVQQYRERLRESERISGLDVLTGLANRRAFESQLRVRIERQSPFSLLMVDLNGFKAINDSNGHLAGDDLLKQFAAELAAQFRETDTVSRWGGDEFVVLVDGDLREAQARADRVRKWALGEYKISGGHVSAKIALDASIGVVQWNGREDGPGVVARADEAVYSAKRTGSAKSPRGGDS